MKRLLIHIISIIFLGSCSNYTKDEINAFLLEGSFLFINENQDTIQIEFLDNCVKTYSREFRVYELWEVSEHNDEIILFFDGYDFTLKSKRKNAMFFANNQARFRLIKVVDNKINPDLIKGKWTEEKYSYLYNDTYRLPPPCPHFEIDTFLIPGVEFSDSTAIINNFCDKQRWVQKTNLKFGIIRFDEYCTSALQWRIIVLTEDTLIVNVKSIQHNKVKYEENKIYVKHGS